MPSAGKSTANIASSCGVLVSDPNAARQKETVSWLNKRLRRRNWRMVTVVVTTLYSLFNLHQTTQFNETFQDWKLCLVVSDWPVSKSKSRSQDMQKRYWGQYLPNEQADNLSEDTRPADQRRKGLVRSVHANTRVFKIYHPFEFTETFWKSTIHVDRLQWYHASKLSTTVVNSESPHLSHLDISAQDFSATNESKVSNKPMRF